MGNVIVYLTPCDTHRCISNCPEVNDINVTLIARPGLWQTELSA